VTKTNMALTDGGLETWLVFHAGFDLPCFAAFPLLESDRGRDALRRYFEPFLAVGATRLAVRPAAGCRPRSSAVGSAAMVSAGI
jgi:S-methylmethionine-dependent homocysteine/selenocysteine methylase